MWEDVSTSAARFGAPALTVSAIITFSCIDETFSFRSARDSCHSEARTILVIPKRAAQRNLLSMQRHEPRHHHRAPPRPFCRTFQNELTPNQAKVTVKQIATTTRPNPARPASYFAYSLAAANPPLAAITRKTNPVTSSHN